MDHRPSTFILWTVQVLSIGIVDYHSFLVRSGPVRSGPRFSGSGSRPTGFGPWIPGLRDNVIKNKLHEYLRNKKADNTNAENGSDGLTIEEFIELFKDVATRPEVYFTLGMFRPPSGQFFFSKSDKRNRFLVGCFNKIIAFWKSKIPGNCIGGTTLDCTIWSLVDTH